MSKITDAVESLARPAAEKLGLRLWDVEYVREAGQWFLRVYIDKDGGIGIDDCEALSRALDPVLDEADLISDSYVFEVSSAGTERELKRPEHFPPFIGSPVEVRLYTAVEGAKVYTGTLTGYADGDITLSAGNREYVFPKAQVAKVRLRME